MKVDEILARHRGESSDYDEFEQKPLTEGGEILANLDNPRLIDRNTDLQNTEERRCCLLIDELNTLGIGPNPKSNLTNSFKNLSVSLGGKQLDRKKEISQGIMKAKAGGSGLGALFTRQPEEGTETPK